jgi:hypothetical protein
MAGWSPPREEVMWMVAGGILRVRAHAFAWALCAALIFVAFAAEAADAAQTTTPSNQVQVWNLNTHGMKIGSPDNTDYRNFVAYITDGTHSPYVPDIVTLQEAGASGDRASCTEFAGLMGYVDHHNYLCSETGHQGGSAVVYRADRFTRASATPVAEKRRTVTGGTCAVDAGDDWQSIAVGLNDGANAKHLSVGSVHFPTTSGVPDADCAWDNMQGINGALPSADMKIVAGDTNRADAVTASGSNNNTFVDWEYWYKNSNLKTTTSPCASPNLCFKDVMYQKWFNAYVNSGNPNPPASGLYGYMHAYEWSWSSGVFVNPTVTDRRDFIWAKPQAAAVAFDATNQPRTVAWSDAGAVPYSDHRGQGALLSYP